MLTLRGLLHTYGTIIGAEKGHFIGSYKHSPMARLHEL